MPNFGERFLANSPDIYTLSLGKSANQAYSAATLTKVTFDTNDSTVLANRDWNYAENRFECSQPGVYLCSVVVVSTATSLFNKDIMIYKNGSLYGYTQSAESNGNAAGGNGLGPPIYLDVGDYLEIYATFATVGNFSTSCSLAIRRVLL